VVAQRGPGAAYYAVIEYRSLLSKWAKNKKYQHKDILCDDCE
jgi:hypothetical protein